jgi:hypothetical protein
MAELNTQIAELQADDAADAARSVVSSSICADVQRWLNQRHD